MMTLMMIMLNQLNQKIQNQLKKKRKRVKKMIKVLKRKKKQKRQKNLLNLNQKVKIVYSVLFFFVLLFIYIKYLATQYVSELMTSHPGQLNYLTPSYTDPDIEYKLKMKITKKYVICKLFS